MYKSWFYTSRVYAIRVYLKFFCMKKYESLVFLLSQIIPTIFAVAKKFRCYGKW